MGFGLNFSTTIFDQEISEKDDIIVLDRFGNDVDRLSQVLSTSLIKALNKAGVSGR